MRDTDQLKQELEELRRLADAERGALTRLYAAHRDLTCTQHQLTEALDTYIMATRAYHWHLFDTHPVHPEEVESTPDGL